MTLTHWVDSNWIVSRYGSEFRAVSLPRDCSIRADDGPLDTVIFRSAATGIGLFRCAVHRAEFRDSGPISSAIVVFPRTSVWIQHEGSRPFVADPNVVTIYNRGQRYERRPISPEGDRCDWFAVSDELARDIVSASDARAGDDGAVTFRFAHAPSSGALYLQQRRLARGAARGIADDVELEEGIIGIVSHVIAIAHQRAPRPLESRRRAVQRRRELAEAAKAELMHSLTVNRSVSEIASALGTSPYHLCRVFRAHTHRTMHDYRTEARMRAAIEYMNDDRRGRVASLSAVAHQFGFATHSHLVRVCRRYLGETPRAIRASL